MVVFAVVDDVAADRVKGVCLVEVAVAVDVDAVDEGNVVVVADMDLVGEFSLENAPPSLRRSLSATRGELQTIHNPCD